MEGRAVTDEHLVATMLQAKILKSHYMLTLYGKYSRALTCPKISQHLAAYSSEMGLRNKFLKSPIYSNCSSKYTKALNFHNFRTGDQSKTYTLVETAGAVNSPAPSGHKFSKALLTFLQYVKGH